jgi:hypothetical protein
MLAGVANAPGQGFTTPRLRWPESPDIVVSGPPVRPTLRAKTPVLTGVWEPAERSTPRTGRDDLPKRAVVMETDWDFGEWLSGEGNELMVKV